MLAKGIDIWGMQQALARINEEKYHGNLDFIFLENKWGKTHFRIRARSYDYLGYRILHSGKLGPWGCWHAHGDLFDAVFKVQPEAVIYSGARTTTGVRRKITKDDGNWEDSNIGSQIFPMDFSASCPCNVFEFMQQRLGREMQSWKDFLKSIKDLSEEDFDELTDGHMSYWPEILVRNCRYEYLKKFISDSSESRTKNLQKIIERRTALECPKKETPLLVGTLKTPEGIAALEKRLKRS